ncbi:hypothetical protein QG516_21190 [Pedobacter gandavensis]|uniref:Uncharacterized protein n=1 Tax=Pedobacter cryoconitis TaxID=188932 RepID=A0A127VEW0_9SPHI|nr:MULTISPECIES: hypothetical protein [Pedobacter]AMP99829.1 hypothetical protein AY601_2955 [Pedobacter cryoconitis]WGQ09029.1 hypothetical protein QG516_21190 [Pedobacter gandavensis]
MKTTIELNLPEDFRTVSELFNIELAHTIDAFIKHVTLYNFITSHNESPNSQATQIFKKYHNTILNTDGMRVADKAKLHVEPVKKVVKLIANGIGANSNSYKKIILDWHASIYPKGEK